MSAFLRVILHSLSVSSMSLDTGRRNSRADGSNVYQILRVPLFPVEAIGATTRIADDSPALRSLLDSSRQFAEVRSSTIADAHFQ